MPIGRLMNFEAGDKFVRLLSFQPLLFITPASKELPSIAATVYCLLLKHLDTVPIAESKIISMKVNYFVP